MKVCFIGVTSSFPSYSGENTRIIQFANNLVKLGVEVHIVVPRFHPDFHETLKDNICQAIVHNVDCRHLPQKPYGLTVPSQIKYLANLHKTEKFDLIHAHMFWGGLLGLKIKRILKTVTIFDPHDWFFCDLYNFPLYNNDLVEFICARRSDATLVTGYLLRQYLIQNYPELSSKLFVIPNGVNEKLLEIPVNEANLSAIRTKLNIAESDSIIVFLGNLVYCQGVDILIKAMKNIRNIAKLIIIGDGPERQNLLALVKTLELYNEVLFVGKVSWDLLIKLLDLSDIAVAPFRLNRYTAWIQPIKVFEYYSREKPVVASNLPGTSEIVKNGINGLLFPSEDVMALSNSLSYLIKNKDIAKEMGKKGKSIIAKKFTWRYSALKLKIVYENLLARAIFT